MIPVWAIALIVVTGVGVTMITVSVTVDAPDSSEVIMECGGLFNFTAYANTPLTIPWNTKVEIPCNNGIETIDRLNYTIAFCNKTGDTYVLDRGDDPCKHNTSLGCDILTLKSNEQAHYTKTSDGTRVVHIYCNDGYTLSGTSAATCVTVANNVTQSMTWNPANISFVCAPGNCSELTIANSNTTNVILALNQIRTPSCNPGYALTPLVSVSCNAVPNSVIPEKTESPSCIQSNCTALAAVINGKWNNNAGPLAAQAVGVNATLMCDTGYYVMPLGFVMTGTCKGNYNAASTWSFGVPTLTCNP